MLNSSSFGSGLYQAAAQAQAFRNFALQHQAQMRMQSPGFYSPHQFFPGQQGVPQGPAPGSLIIHDSFERSNQQDNYSPLTKNSEHGEIVAAGDPGDVARAGAGREGDLTGGVRASERFVLGMTAGSEEFK